MGVFERSNRIFRDEGILSDEHEPEDLNERDEELEEFKQALQPVIQGSPPNNIFLYGKTGVGKTVATKYLLGHLESDAERYEDVNVTAAHINCENATSSYQVTIELVNTFRDRLDKPLISESGYPHRAVYNKLWDVFDEIGGTILITLDEIDYLGEDASVLYQLPRARANGNLESARVGIIGISNDFTYKDDLDPRILDTLAEKELHFPPYDANQLRSILTKRAEAAFQSDVLADDVIPKCAALAAQDKGSARQALDLLLNAGQLARGEGAETVVVDHVSIAHTKLQQEEIHRGMRELTTHGKLALSSVLVLTINNPNMPISRNDVYDKYQELADTYATDPLTDKSLHRHLSDLVMQGILCRNETNNGRAGGRRYTYKIDVPVDDAIAAMEASFTQFDFSELREVAIQRDLIN